MGSSYSDVLVVLTRAPLPVEWAVLRWSDLRVDGTAVSIALPSGREIAASRTVVGALEQLSSWQVVATGRRRLDHDALVLGALPGARDRWIGRRWARAVIEGSAVAYGEYVDVREAYEAEVAEGSSDRAAWTRARARLLGRPAPVRGRSGRSADLSIVPEELREAFVGLAERAGIKHSTARGYQCALRRVFERTGGHVPNEGELHDVLSEVEREHSYGASVRSAWSALGSHAASETASEYHPIDR